MTPALISAASPTVTVDAQTLSAFLLVLARTTAWSVSSPILAAKQLSPIARLVAGVSLAIFITPLVDASEIPSDLAPFVNALVVQVMIGIALGFLTGLLLAAVEMAGNLADYVSGFSYGAQIDPVTGSQSAAFQRFGNLTMIALLFATGGAGIIVAGFVHSFDVYGLTQAPHLTNDAASALGHLITTTMIAGLEIGAPLLGAVFLTDVGLALTARFVPQANVLNVGLSLKALVAFSALGGVLVLLPGQLSSLLDDAVRTPAHVINPGGGAT